MSYEIDTSDDSHLTVNRIDGNGERWDLNHGGKPIKSVIELTAFIRELEEEGAYGPEVTRELLGDVKDA